MLSFFFTRDTNKYEHFESTKYETIIGQERSALEGAKRELDQCKTKVEGLSHDVKYFLYYFLKFSFLKFSYVKQQ